jgi:hypothetical protein
MPPRPMAMGGMPSIPSSFGLEPGDPVARNTRND